MSTIVVLPAVISSCVIGSSVPRFFAFILYGMEYIFLSLSTALGLPPTVFWILSFGPRSSLVKIAVSLIAGIVVYRPAMLPLNSGTSALLIICVPDTESLRPVIFALKVMIACHPLLFAFLLSVIVLKTICVLSLDNFQPMLSAFPILPFFVYFICTSVIVSASIYCGSISVSVNGSGKALLFPSVIVYSTKLPFITALSSTILASFLIVRCGVPEVYLSSVSFELLEIPSALTTAAFLIIYPSRSPPFPFEDVEETMASKVRTTLPPLGINISLL